MLRAVFFSGGTDARRLVEGYAEHYNDVRLNSAIGYITSKDMLAGFLPACGSGSGDPSSFSPIACSTTLRATVAKS